MEYKLKKPLKKLGQKEFAQDIKKFIRSTHEFYTDKVPEMKFLAKRLNEEYKLEDFYKVFNKLWKTGYHNERALAINALKLYRGEFELKTWMILRPKLKEIKSWDVAESIGEILGDITLKYPALRNEIERYSKDKSPWLKKIALSSGFSLLKIKDEKNINFLLRVIKTRVYDSDEEIQKSVGKLLKEISKYKKEIVKKFVLRNMDMPEIIFLESTENLKDLRKLRNIKKLASNKKGFWLWKVR